MQNQPRVWSRPSAMNSAGKPASNLGVLERIVQLCVGHGPRLEPAVEHLGNAPIDAGFAFNREVEIDELAMQIVHLHACQFGKLGPHRCSARRRSHHSPTAAAASPHPIAREAQSRAVEPFAEAPVAHVVRHPVDLRVGRKQALAHVFDAYVPARHGPVDERGLGAITEWIAVDDDVLLVERTRILERADDVRSRPSRADPRSREPRR